MCFLIADEVLVFDRVTQTITVLVNASTRFADGYRYAGKNHDCRARAAQLLERLPGTDLGHCYGQLTRAEKRRVVEIARMLGGKGLTSVIESHARELLASAE